MYALDRILTKVYLMDGQKKRDEKIKKHPWRGYKYLSKNVKKT